MQNAESFPSLLSTRHIVTKRILDLKPARVVSRTHSKRQIHQIAESIRAFGFINPVLIEPDGRVIAGHGRVLAAKLLGLDGVPTVLISHLSEAELRAYVIADNRLAELAGWDRQTLALELEHLLEMDLSFSIEVVGFEAPEIDILIGELGTEDEPEDPVEPIDRTNPAVTERGDVWLLGPHRLLCGDARDPADYAKLLGPNRADLVITDPPYNVKVNGHVSGLGRTKHREFAFASGEMSPVEFTSFLSAALGSAVRASRDGALHYVFMDWRHISELLQAARLHYSEYKNLCVWAKSNAGMGSLYRSQHELVFVFKVGSAAHINNVELGRHGRYRTNVWTCAGANSFGRTRDDDLTMHPTVKPVTLLADAILDASRRGDIVLDPFGGSGSTLIAADRTARRGYLIEYDPHYVDTTLKRWQALTGSHAIHDATGQSFDQRSSGIKRSFVAALSYGVL